MEWAKQVCAPYEKVREDMMEPAIPLLEERGPDLAGQKFGKCGGCGQSRTVYQYKDGWLCRGPSRCWQKRTGERRPRKSR